MCTQVRLSVGVVVLKPPSLIGGDPPSQIASQESKCQALSHYANGTVETAWPWRNIDVESCWRWHCRGDVGRSVMSMSSHASVVPAVVT
jgi:hypothetical protein